MSDNLVDRDKEIKDLAEIIQYSNTQNEIIIVTGISGIGKSGLVNKFKIIHNIDINMINVKMSKNSVSTIENLQYFNAIYKAFEEFSIRNNTLVPTPTQHGISSIGNLIRWIFSVLKSKNGFGDAISLSEPSEEKNIVRKRDYILHILSNSDVILDIENIQNIDTYSFELLKSIISNVTNKIFILEYTLGEQEEHHFMNFYKELLETGAHVTELRVEKMDFIYARQLAPKNKNINLTLLEAIYDSSNGNLMEIILANEKTTKKESNINISLNNISKDEKYIAYIITLNGGNITYDLLYKIIINPKRNGGEYLFHISEEKIEEIIDSLISKRIIKKDNTIIALAHDSVQDEINKHGFSSVLMCAYNDVKDYYLRLLSCNTDNSEILEKLIALFIKFSDQELLSLIPKIKDFLMDIKYPKLIICELEKYRKELLNNATINIKSAYNLTLMLVEVSLSNKLFDEAQKNLDLIFDKQNQYHIALQAQIYALQETFEVESKLKNLVDNVSDNSRLKLILELCYMYFCMKMYNTNKTKIISELILNNIHYQKYKEYAYVLRNYAELCDSNTECIKYYKQSLKIFKENNMIFDMACVYISLSMIYSYEGKLRVAQTCIDKAIKLAPKNISQCYVLNNRSVIAILGNSFTDKTEKDLIASALLSVTLYEKIIIYCNLLVYYCLSGNYKKAEIYVKKIESLNYQKFNYEELSHIVYQNMLFYYKSVNNETSFQKYYKKIMDLINDPNARTSTKELAKSMLGLSSNNSFYSGFSYRVDFLGYWEFNIDNDLDHS